MASRRSSASSSTVDGGAGGRTAWLALAWLCFLAWLTLLSFNAAPYVLGRRAWKPASDLPQRLIALPAPVLAALHLSPALTTFAAWIIAALALFLGVLVTALTFSSYTPGADAASRSASAAVNARLAALITQQASPTPHMPLPAPITPASAATNPLAEPQSSPAVTATLSPSGWSGLLRQAGQAGQASRVFISHSSADNDFGLGLAQWLKASLGDDDAVFYDSDGGLLGGDEWPQRLQFELGEADVFVLLLSPQALASGWVRKEWNYALRRAVSIGGKVIIPVMHQETPLWPFLADYQIIDFSAPGQFEIAFDDLLVAVRLGRSRMAELRGLRGERRGPPFDVAKLPLPERFIGRDADIAWALERLAPELSLTDALTDAHEVAEVAEVAEGNGRVASRLASIAAANGLAGIGKSALAGVVARILYATNRYSDGIAVVACNGLDDPVTVLRRALARFDPEEREPPEDTLDGLASLAKRVFSQLPHALIVLDNIEPELAIEQVTAALRVAGAALLLTSRQRLSASAAPPEDSRELDLLTLDEAVAVFIENRERADQTFVQADADLREADRAAIAGIVTALGRHTLAVKLAAARTKGRDLARLAREYAADPRLGVNLRDGAEAVDVTLASSVASLSDAARLLFAALGAFTSDDIGRDALLAVGAALDDPDPIHSLDALRDLRLADAVVDTTLPDGADRERLRLHPLVHAYARDLLDGARSVANDAPCPPERRAETQRA
ncbi:MAG TPA: toll/interleukin-1 receptor domain-containing protein, partial [Ktedonobacterales bacterium]|nr:toll/interleukin-1 receptor domain-containing protein [Ktedonobacterales bacterium]